METNHDRTNGENLIQRKHDASLQKGESQKWGKRSGRNRNGRNSRVSDRELGRASRENQETEVQTTACFKSGDTEAKRGNKKPRHTERGRPHH